MILSFLLFVAVFVFTCEAFSVDKNLSLLKFKDWCESKGIITPLDLEVRSEKGDGDYRYMKYSNNKSIASRPEKLSGPILRVPLNACIVSDTLETLAQKLKAEKDLGKDSEFEPYIHVLPSLSSPSLQSMPFFWSEEKLEIVSEFDGGQIYQRVQEVKTIVKDLNLDPWAYICVRSRANFLNQKGYAMTPVLDMINHDDSSKTSATILENELYLSVEKCFAFDEEVFISYGSFSNLDTFCDYGFVDSEKNFCKRECINVLMIRRPPVKVTIDGKLDGKIDSGSLALLRSYLASPELVEAKLSTDLKVTMNTVFTRPISDTNEEDVYSLIASFIDEAIYEGTSGIEWARDQKEEMVEKYLLGRIDVLQKGLNYIKRKYPDLVY